VKLHKYKTEFFSKQKSIAYLRTAPRIAQLCGKVILFSTQITFLVVRQSQYKRTLGHKPNLTKCDVLYVIRKLFC